MLCCLYYNGFTDKLAVAISKLKESCISSQEIEKLFSAGSNLPNTLKPYAKIANILIGEHIIKVRDREDKNDGSVLKCLWRNKVYNTIF